MNPQKTNPITTHSLTSQGIDSAIQALAFESGIDEAADGLRSLKETIEKQQSLCLDTAENQQVFAADLDVMLAELIYFRQRLRYAQSMQQPIEAATQRGDEQPITLACFAQLNAALTERVTAENHAT